MRCVVTGIDEEGRSAVIREEQIDPTTFTVLWESLDGPPVVFPTDDPHLVDLNGPPGEIKWLMNFMRPHTDVAGHWTETIDFGIVLEGEVEMILDTGSVILARGDCSVVAGVKHGWRTGDVGCLRAVLLYGVKKR